MADALVTVVLEKATSFLEHEIQENVGLVVGAKKEVKKLSTKLATIQEVLNDAEKKQVKDKSVRVWLEKLQDISYDADDVLDEWNTAILKAQIERPISGPKFTKVWSCFPSPSFSLSRIFLRRNIGSKIKDIKERLDEILIEKNQFHFILSGSVEEPERLKTTSMIDVTEVRGRGTDKDTILNKLWCESSQEEMGLRIISIVGMGGIGKTTLAQLVYNDDKVNAHFDKRIWVCVSDPFDNMRIARAILEALDGSAPNFLELETPLQKIKESIMGKTLLLVLDDVWTEDYQKWEPLKLSLKFGARGSRILVTTRSQRVAKIMETTDADMLTLEKLSDEECWLLFSQIAFSGKGGDEREKLEDIGKKIANKCKGLPLAAKTLGSLMRFKETKQDWQNVLNSETWELEDQHERGLFPPLLLSYYDLPSPMKWCFSYCAVFPKDSKIKKDNLIKLWMAQDFLSSKGSIDMETKGEEYFNNLVMRSFFQDFEKDKDGTIIGCKMHDIVHDFAQFLMNNVRHSTIIFDTMADFPTSFAKNLRTLEVQYNKRIEIVTSLSILFRHFTCLRALNISNSPVEKLPRMVGKLIHLRYLNMSSMKLRELPDTLCDLYNLQTLNLNWCRFLCKLPQRMGKLLNLRHLEIDGTFSLSIMPKGMGEMSSLRTLSKFVISDDRGEEGCKLGELKNLNHLKGHLQLTGLGNVTNVGDAVEAKLNKKRLHGLELEFSEGVNEVMEGVIEALHPHPDLEYLSINTDYEGIMFPNWMILLPNLKNLDFSFCTNCEHLPPLGKLPSLERLNISWLENLKSVGHEFLGIGENDHDGTSKKDGTAQVIVFPKLKELKFRVLHKWEEWADPTRKRQGEEEEEDSSITIMPNLLSLKIYDCNKLKALPHYLLKTPLREFIILECDILNQRYQDGTGEYCWHIKISHIQKLIED